MNTLEKIRESFPMLQRRIEGRPIVYLDNAATSFAPASVIAAVQRYYEREISNVHRGKHALSEEISEAFEEVRGKVARFIGASPREIVFTHGTTDAINMVALGLSLRSEENVVTTTQEHHSNLLPWMGRTEVRMSPVGEDGRIDTGDLAARIDDRTRIVAVAHASNVTGRIHDVAPIASIARARGVPLLIDAAQSAAHLRLNVAELGCDFLAFSAHKMLGPTGVGVLYVRRGASESLRAEVRGGGSVNRVSSGGFELKPLPYGLEAGTPNIAGVLGLGAAIDFLSALDPACVEAHENALAARLIEGLGAIPQIRILGPTLAERRLPLATIVLEAKQVAADHLAMLLSDGPKIMVRSGTHCCHPFFDGLGLNDSLRASAHLYSTLDEVDVFVRELRALSHLLAPGREC